MNQLRQAVPFPEKAQTKPQLETQPHARVQSWRPPKPSRKPHEPFVPSLLNPAASWLWYPRQPMFDPDLARRQHKKRISTHNLAREAIVRSAGKAWSELLCACECAGLQPPQRLPENWEFDEESGGIRRVGGDGGGGALSKPKSSRAKSSRRETPARWKLGVPQSYTRPLRGSNRSSSTSSTSSSKKAIELESERPESQREYPWIEVEWNIAAPGLGRSVNGDKVESSNRVKHGVRRPLPGDVLSPEERYRRDRAARKAKPCGMSTSVVRTTASAPSQIKMSAEELQAFILATLKRLHREAKEKHK